MSPLAEHRVQADRGGHTYHVEDTHTMLSAVFSLIEEDTQIAPTLLLIIG